MAAREARTGELWSGKRLGEGGGEEAELEADLELESTPTAPPQAAPPPRLCRPKRVSFGRGIVDELEPTGEGVVGAGPGGV